MLYTYKLNLKNGNLTCQSDEVADFLSYESDWIIVTLPYKDDTFAKRLIFRQLSDRISYIDLIIKTYSEDVRDLNSTIAYLKYKKNKYYKILDKI